MDRVVEIKSAGCSASMPTATTRPCSSLLCAEPHARYLQLARLLERCRLDQAVILAGALEIAPATLIDSYRQALAWACAELDV